jgi:GH25 family lysozyme M1 (1,4-beta-N-acetylmuramidase)
MIVGNDISHWNDVSSWDTYKNNSNFVILKSSEGNGFIDPKFFQYQEEARRVGLPLGYYHFARPEIGNTPEAEADWFLRACGRIREGEFLCLDYEVVWTGNPVDWCKKFLDYIFGKIACRPFVYLNQSLIASYDWMPVVAGNYALWVAAYTYDPNQNEFLTGAWGLAAMQQWTNQQQVPGINGSVDGNVFFGTVEQLKKYGFANPIPPSPVVIPPVEPIPEPPTPPATPPTEPSEPVTTPDSLVVCENKLEAIHDAIWERWTWIGRTNGWKKRLAELRGLLPA